MIGHVQWFYSRKSKLGLFKLKRKLPVTLYNLLTNYNLYCAKITHLKRILQCLAVECLKNCQRNQDDLLRLVPEIQPVSDIRDNEYFQHNVLNKKITSYHVFDIPQIFLQKCMKNKFVIWENRWPVIVRVFRWSSRASIPKIVVKGKIRNDHNDALEERL